MADGVKLATAYIDVTADVTGVNKQVGTALDDVSTLGKDAGKKLGQNISDGIASSVDVKPAGKKISDGIADVSKGIVKKFDEVSTAARKTSGEITSNFQIAQKAVSTVQSSAETVKKSISQIGDTASDTKKAVGGIGDAARNLQNGDVLGSIKGFGDSFTAVVNNVGNLQTAFNDIKASLTAIPGLSKLASGALIADLGAVYTTVALPLAATLGTIAYGWQKGLQNNPPGPGGGTLGGLGQGAPGTSRYGKGPAAPWPGPADQGYQPGVTGNRAIPPKPTEPPPAGTEWKHNPMTNQWQPVAPGAPLPWVPTGPGGGTAGPAGAAGPVSWSTIDAIAASHNLTVTSAYRSPNGPTVAGVAAASYHGSGRAHDYGGSPQDRLAFAQDLATNYGGSLAELIYDAPGFNATIKDGQVVGPFGAFYTLGQAGDHSDHVHVAFDDGGWLPPGETLATNNTGRPEWVMGPDQMKSVGEAPNKADPVMQALDFARSAGFIPSGAGATSVAGTSFIAGLLNLGNEVVGGLIDTGASAAQMAIEAGVAAGSMGAGAAGAPAAAAAGGIGIQIAANEAKRLSSYGFQMAAIGADALIEQLFGPFGGVPRWIGYDYTSFLPSIDVGAIGTTTVEKAFKAAAKDKEKQQQQADQQPGGPVTPEHLPGAQPVGPPVPPFGSRAAPSAPGPAPAPAAPTTPAPAPAPASAPPAAPPNPMDWLKNALSQPRLSAPPSMTALPSMDEGGWWPPGVPSINTTGRPELVLNPDQTAAAVAGNSRGSAPLVSIGAIYGMSPDDVANKIEAKQRLAMMRYAGRP